MKLVVVPFVLIVGLMSLWAQEKPEFDLKKSILRGKEIYLAQCATCHREAGEGVEGVYPPLAKSDYLMADNKKSAQGILYGLNGPIKVNSVSYDAEMPLFDLNDQKLSDLLNYIRNSWGNKGGAVKPEDLKAMRK
jgi:mono/diheme cytochrome c family protein